MTTIGAHTHLNEVLHKIRALHARSCRIKQIMTIGITYGRDFEPVDPILSKSSLGT